MGLSVQEHPRDVYWISKSIHRVVRLRRRTLIFLAAMGPGIITMIADNDAGGISTYAQTGAKTGFNLLWAFIILVPMAYYVQEMTVRLGAITKRGHAEAIFDGFGKFWGWFSIFDLALINWLTLVTEYIGMTQAMRLFNIPEWITFLSVTLLLPALSAALLAPVGCVGCCQQWFGAAGPQMPPILTSLLDARPMQTGHAKRRAP